MIPSGHAPNSPGKRYARLLRYARPYQRGWCLITTVTLLGSAVSLLQPWPMKVLVDQVLGNHPLAPGLAGLLPGAGSRGGVLAWVALAVLGLFALNSLVDVVVTYAWIRVGNRMVYDLARDLFGHIQRQSLRFHSQNPVGDSMSRITTDSWCVYGLVDTLLLGPGRALIMTAVMVLVMRRLNGPLTLVALWAAPLMGGAAFWLGRRIRRVARAKREIESRLQSHVQQTLSGIHVVQAFAQEEREHGRFRAFARAAIRAQQQNVLLSNFATLGSGLITAVGTGLILLIGARQVLAGSLSLGGLLVFLAYLATLQAQMKTLAGTYTSLQSLGGDIDRVSEVLESEPEVQDHPDATPLGDVRGEIRLENVTFGYEPGRPILNGVTLEARAGQTVAIVGPTGIGKSTLTGLIPRFFDPWEGRVLLDGRDVRDLRLRDLREHVALVLQEPFLFPLTIAENVAYGRPGATRGEVETAARAANAHDFITALPQGYDTVIGEHGATLSGGERQRLAIARALLKNASILILDEPTSALDVATERLLVDAISRLMRGRTTFIIAHRLSTVRQADQIVVLADGRIAETGTHEELVRHGRLYARYCGLQNGTGEAGQIRNPKPEIRNKFE